VISGFRTCRNSLDSGLYMSILSENMERGAAFSRDRQYRYRLWRTWDSTRPAVLFIMLNPSRADEHRDDPTIRRCINFAHSWGYGGLYVGNLFAYRSTVPKELLVCEDPIGKANRRHLKAMSQCCTAIVCGWGNKPIIDKLQPRIKSLGRLGLPLYTIDLSCHEVPKHPLYLRAELGMRRYELT